MPHKKMSTPSNWLQPLSVRFVASQKRFSLIRCSFISIPTVGTFAKRSPKNVNNKTVEELYDPKVELVVEEIGKLVGQFGAARVIIEGHTDSSMKGQVPASLVKELSLNRANAVKEAVVRKFNLSPNQFAVEGVGWDRPSDPGDPLNHAKNRRVEVRVFAAEKQ